jgi:hypothetical protein
MEGAEDLDVQAPKAFSAYRVRNVQIVAAGTGGGPPLPDDLRNRVAGASRPITSDPGKWAASRVGVAGSSSTG